MVGGLIPGTLFSLAVRLSPQESLVSTTVGWMQQCSSMGQFAGPPLVAWVAASRGGWAWTGLTTATFALGGMLLSFLIARRLALRG
jgi:MFS family permease